jgi:hypothetical protein
MREIQIRVNSQWVGKLDGNADTTAKVRYVTTLKGEEYITYEKTEPNLLGEMTTRLASSGRRSFLYAFKEKEDFFVVGGQYTGSGYTYYIQEIFTVSNPINENHRKSARAVLIDQNGKRWMEMLNLWDFKYAKRVK